LGFGGNLTTKTSHLPVLSPAIISKETFSGENKRELTYLEANKKE